MAADSVWENGSAGEEAEQVYQVSAEGRQLATLIFAVEDWLARSPGTRFLLREDREAQLPMWSGLEGWTTGIVPALAGGPLTLSELELALGDVGRRSLESTLRRMSEAGLLETRTGPGGKEAYAATTWLREGIAPLAVLVRVGFRVAEMGEPWEPPVAAGDVEAMFQLTLPLLQLPRELSGSCRLVVELPGGEEAGATAHLGEGQVAWRGADLGGAADGWVSGSLVAWLDAMIDGETDLLEFDGDERLPRALAAALHERLFGD
jgi:DNA-binding HxlR family transcriptional regulator